jgi:hypothetical protein
MVQRTHERAANRAARRCQEVAMDEAEQSNTRSTGTRGTTMPEVQELSSISATTEPLGFCKEDWLVIDEALHRVARSLRKIEREEKLKKLREAGCQSPGTR